MKPVNLYFRRDDSIRTPCELVVIFFIKYDNDHQNQQHLNYENFMRKLTFYHWSSIISKKIKQKSAS